MTAVLPPLHAWFGGDHVTTALLGNGGFSGSRVILVESSEGGRFVLKSFAAHVPHPRLLHAHTLMHHLRGVGLTTVPEVFATRAARMRPSGSAATLAIDATGTAWELVAFVPGSPREAPNPAEAQEALAALARLHGAAATLPNEPAVVGPSAGVTRRQSQAARILAEPWRVLGADTVVMRDRLSRAIEIFETRRGSAALVRVIAEPQVPVLTQTVLRDVWRDHVLFTADGRVSGFVDYHALARDTPAADLARLLGDWDGACEDDSLTFDGRWQTALAAYESVRLLSPRERLLIPWLHATGVICGLDNWFRWLLVERRSFHDMARVLERIDRLIRQLPRALDELKRAGPGCD